MKRNLKMKIGIGVAALLFVGIISGLVFRAASLRDIMTEEEVYASEELVEAAFGLFAGAYESLGFTQEQVSDAYVGTPFRMAHVISEDRVKKESGIWYCPIISEESVIAFITLMKTDGNISFNVGKDFAPQLQNVLSERQDVEIALYSHQNRSGLFGITKENDPLVIHSGVAAPTDSDPMIPQFSACAQETNVISLSRILEVWYRPAE